MTFLLRGSWTLTLTLLLAACSSTTVVTNGGDGGRGAPEGNSPGNMDASSGKTGYGPECQRYLACCEKGASAAECEASINAQGTPSTAEPYCKSTADAQGCP
jgi:hypothetical protein